MPATIALAHAGGTTGEWAGALREVFGEYRAPTGVAAAVGAAPAPTSCDAVAERVQAHGRRPAPAPRGQARPRRPLQRRRADRRGRPRRRHGGRLPGHPPHARADRGRRPATRTSTWSACRSSRAATSSSCPRWCGCCGPRASTRRSSSAASSPRTTGAALTGAGVAAVYTPEGLRARPDHGRHRRPRRGPPGRLGLTSTGRRRRPRPAPAPVAEPMPSRQARK